MTERPHGYARYKLDGCRCYTCGWAVAQYNDTREQAMRRGTWQPYTDAAPVRDHIRRLQACGMGLRAIAAAANVDRQRLQHIVTGRSSRGAGPQKQVRPALAAAILAVEPSLDLIAASTPIDPTGTRRRIQALGANGWPQTHLAAAVGMRPSNFNSMIGRPHVLARRARQIRDLYAELWQADPQAHGVEPQPYSRARNHARANGWAPPGAWDDELIDNPAAHPEWTGVCGTPDGYRVHRRIGIPACQPCLTARSEDRRARAAA